MYYTLEHSLIGLSNNSFDKQESWTIIIALIGIVGIILGVVISFFLVVWKKNKNNKELKNALILELEGNLLAIEQKKDIIEKAINALKVEKMLPTHSVPLPTLIFDTHFVSIIMLFNPIQRDLIQHIYGRIHLIDGFLENFENKFLSYLDNKSIKTPYIASIGMLQDISKQYSNTQELINSILDGNPVDIYNRKEKKEHKRPMKVPTPDDIKKERGV